MTREDFIKVLKGKRYSYYIENGWVIVNYDNRLDLESLKTLPERIEFRNHGYVNLCHIKNLPKDIIFNNQGGVYLDSLENLTEDTKFENSGYIVALDRLGLILGLNYKFPLRIDGILDRRLLNKMISLGLFDK
jgi:hypothetical protein